MSWGVQASLFPIKIPSKSIYAKAHAADPVYSLRWNSLHQTLETPLCRFYKVPIPGEGGTRGPKGPKGTQGDPRGPKGTQGRLRRPWGGMGPWGPLGLFRSHSAWKAISSGRFFRKKGLGTQILQNGTKTDRLKHLGGLGPEIIQNGTKTCLAAIFQ